MHSPSSISMSPTFAESLFSFASLNVSTTILSFSVIKLLGLTTVLITRERPKSHNLILQFELSKMLAGLISRCTTPAEWRNDTALKSWYIINCAWASCNALALEIYFCKSVLTCLKTMKIDLKCWGSLLGSRTSQSVTMLGCGGSCFSILISRRIREASSRLLKTSGIFFIATPKLECLSVAEITNP